MASEAQVETPVPREAPPAAYEAAVDAIIGMRSEQQDAAQIASVRLGVSHDGALLLVADGMGGHAGGRVASVLATEAFLEAVSDKPHDDAASRLAAGLSAANRAIAERVAASPEFAGMGCTLVAAILDGRKLTWISVGDSLLMTVHDGSLRRLNQDHSMGEVLDQRAAAGEISETEARESPQRHMLRSALTGGRIALIDENHATLAAGTLLFAATDGVLTLTQADLLRMAHEAARPADFIGAVLAEIGRVIPEDQDNATVAAARVPGGRRGGPTPAQHKRRIWRPIFSALAFLVMIAALALIGLVIWQGRTSTNSPQPAASPANPTPPLVAQTPEPHARGLDAQTQRFPVGPLGPPTPSRPRTPIARPWQKPPVTPRAARPGPPKKAAVKPTSDTSRKAMDAKVDEALQPPKPRPPSGPSPD